MKLILFLYNILLIIITPFAAIFGYFIMKRKGKADFWLERFGFIKRGEARFQKTIWFHAASVGETRSIKPIIDRLRKETGDISIAVSTMTAAGRLEALNFLKADAAFLLPIENAPAISRIIEEWNVKAVVIVDTEIWPNFIFTASSLAPLFLINGRISDKTFKKYKFLRLFFKPILKKFACIAAKSYEDETRFRALTGDADNIITAGNIKFQERKNPDEISVIDELKNTRFFLAASTHEGEEAEILSWFDKGKAGFDKIVIAPRHIERSGAIKKLAETNGYSAGLFSEKDFYKDVLIMDAFGKLEGLYLLADKIFIGGSLVSVGGHNIYEALQFKKTAGVGKYMFSFKEIYEDALKFNVAEEISPQNARLWLNRDDTSGSDKNFLDFFREIDKKNNRTINTVTDMIKSVM